VGNRIRGVAGGPPCPALLRDLPVHWTVVISPRGEGPTGRGNSFPLPCLSRSNHLTSRRHPSRAFGGRLPIRFCRQPPPRPRLRRSSPAQEGAGSVLAISGEQPCPALLRDLPMCWTVVISPRGEGPTGRGNSFPLPCLSRSNHLASRRSHPSLWQGTRILRRPPPPRPRIAGSEPGGAISPAVRPPPVVRAGNRASPQG